MLQPAEPETLPSSSNDAVTSVPAIGVVTASALQDSGRLPRADRCRRPVAEQLLFVAVEQGELVVLDPPCRHPLESGDVLALDGVGRGYARHPRRRDRAEVECLAVDRVRAVNRLQPVDPATLAPSNVAVGATSSHPSTSTPEARTHGIPSSDDGSAELTSSSPHAVPASVTSSAASVAPMTFTRRPYVGHPTHATGLRRGNGRHLLTAWARPDALSQMDERSDEYGPGTYGDRIAELYDELYGDGPFLPASEAIVAFLGSVKGEGPALELGIGTGRIALPLREAGVEVVGIDASPAMVAKLRAKPGGEDIEVTMADFADFDLARSFGLVYVVFNTFFGLLDQERQLSCFRAVARHLGADGVFAIEAFVPDHARFDRGQRVSAIRVEPDEVHIEVTKHDPLAQTSDSQHLIIRDDRVRLFPVKIRFATVPELDLMAKLAGLRLRERWADWDRSPFDSRSGKHISVWERGAAALQNPQTG